MRSSTRQRQTFLVIAASAVIVFGYSCRQFTGFEDNGPDGITVEVSPSAVSLSPGATQQFDARVVGRSGSEQMGAIEWSASGGTIDAAGLYKAGDVPGSYGVIARESELSISDTALVSVSGSGTQPDIYAWNFDSVGGPRNDRFGRLTKTFGSEIPQFINTVQNAGLAADGEWFAESLDLCAEGNPMPWWGYNHYQYEGELNEVYVRQRVLFTDWLPTQAPKTIRFFDLSNNSLAYLTIHNNGVLHLTYGGGDAKDSGPGLFQINTWHWLEVYLNANPGGLRNAKVWLDGELVIEHTASSSQSRKIAQTRFLWGGGGAREDQPCGFEMYVRFDQIGIASFHMGLP